MLTSADLLNLIRLTEIELNQIHKDIDSDDPEIRDDAGEISIQMDKLAHKLEKMYCDTRPEDSELPTYDDYIALLEKSKN